MPDGFYLSEDLLRDIQQMLSDWRAGLLKFLPRNRRRTAGGSGLSSGVVWYQVVQSLARPDLELLPEDPLFEGFSTYKLLAAGKTPAGVNEDLIFDLEIEHAIGLESPQRDLRDLTPWLTVGELVPVITRKVDDATRHYIDRTLQWSGGSADSSISWIVTSTGPRGCITGRTGAVFG